MDELMRKEVWIIGVSSPCPRCDLLRQRVERLTKEAETSVDVKKIVYTDPEAREFAVSIGKEPGTAMDVAQRAKIKIDWKRYASVLKNPPSHPEDIDFIDGPARQWSPELDEILRPFQEKSESVGMLMTPIVVVDGAVKHHGSVPTIEQIRSWLLCAADVLHESLRDGGRVKK
jgi:hypothetical protein